MAFSVMTSECIELLKINIKLALLEDLCPIATNIQYASNLYEFNLREILPNITANAPASHARIFTRQNMIFCGKFIVETIFTLVQSAYSAKEGFNYSINWHCQEGANLKPNDSICHITAPQQILLLLERTILNFIQIVSATATTTRTYVDKIDGCKSIDNANVKILDTRKTIPQLRLLQKYAVTVGGGHNQRFGLYDAILIKENNLKNFNTIKDAVNFYKNQTLSLKSNPLWKDSYQIQIEVETLEQFKEALKLQVPQIMLDNMTMDDIKMCVQLLQEFSSQNTLHQKIELEAAGDVNLENVRQYAMTGVHRISIGSLTKNIAAINLSMLIE